MRKYLSILLSLSIISFCLSACSSQPAAELPGEAEEVYCFEDDLGESFSLHSPKRVAVLIGSFADIWCLAGGRESIVAAADDSWTSFHLDLPKDTVNTGTVKEPNLEHILSANPDFIIGSCNTASNVGLKDVMRQAGIPFACFDVQNFGDYLRVLKICTELTGHQENYEMYGSSQEKTIEDTLQRADGSSPRILCLRATGASCKIKGSRDFLLGEMLSDLGCVNIADSETSLLENLSLETVMKEDPEYIFCVLQGSDDTAARETLEKNLISNPAWGSLSAVKEGHFYLLEQSLYNLKPNARWGEAYEKLADILYPNAG